MRDERLLCEYIELATSGTDFNYRISSYKNRIRLNARLIISWGFPAPLENKRLVSNRSPIA